LGFIEHGEPPWPLTFCLWKTNPSQDNAESADGKPGKSQRLMASTGKISAHDPICAKIEKMA
jgi:hypothetical protein